MFKLYVGNKIKHMTNSTETFNRLLKEYCDNGYALSTYICDRIWNY